MGPTRVGGVGQPTYVPPSSIGNRVSEIPAPTIEPTAETPLSSAAPTDTSTVAARPVAPGTDNSALAAAERVQAFLADGQLDGEEANLLLNLLETGELNTADLSPEQRTQIQASGNQELQARVQSTEASADVSGVSEPDPNQEAGRELADSRLSDRMTSVDRATGRRSDVSYNFLVSEQPAARSANGFFAQEAQRYSEMGQRFGEDAPALQPLADDMSQLYQTLANSTSTRASQREEQSVAVMEQTAQVLDTLANLPPGTLDDETIRQITANVTDLSTVAAAFPGLAGTSAGTHNVSTSLDRFTAVTVQRQRQMEGTAISGRRSSASDSPDIQEALQTYGNDHRSMQTVLQRLDGLQARLQSGSFESMEAYQAAVQAAAPGSSERFQTALGNLGGAQFRARESQQTAQRGETLAGQAAETATQAFASRDAAEAVINSAQQNMTQARELMGRYRDLSAQSRGQSQEAQSLRTQALALAGESRQMLAQVQNSSFGGTLSAQTQRVEQDLSSVQAMADRIQTQVARVEASLDNGDRRADQLDGQIETIETRQEEESRNPEVAISRLTQAIAGKPPGAGAHANLGFRIGVGTNIANITGGIRVGLHAEVGYGHGASYILSADLGLEARAKAELFGFLEASASFERAFSGGVAFYNEQDMQRFGNQITGVLGLLDSPVANRDEIGRRMQALEQFASEHGYSSTGDTATVEVRANTGVSMTGSTSSSDSRYSVPADINGDGRIAEGEIARQRVLDDRQQFGFDLGGIGVNYSRESSRLIENNNPNFQGDAAAPQSRQVFSLRGDIARLSADPSGTIARVMSNLQGQGVALPPQAQVTQAFTQALRNPNTQVGQNVSLNIAVENNGRVVVTLGNDMKVGFEAGGNVGGAAYAEAYGNLEINDRIVVYDSRAN